MYVYAFIKTPEAQLTLPNGIVGELQVVSEGLISAVVEPSISAEKMDAIAQDDNLLKHAYVIYGLAVCELFHQTTILPLKFYHCFANLASLQKHLKAHQERYLSQIERLDGKGEYILKLTAIEPSSSSVSAEVKGKDYFLAKKQALKDRQDLKARQASEWERLVEEILQAYPNAIATETQIYILEDKQAENSLHQQLQAWQNLCPSWELELGEAIPPYDFLKD